MNRLKTCCKYILFVGSFLCSLSASSDQEKPNVILILIDDLSHYGVNIYGSHKVSSNRGFFKDVEFSTPRMDQLAKDGMLCEHAFTYPLCENTRVALMSGQNNNRNFLNCKSQHASDITFGDTFKKAGYATGIFGKWKQTRGTQSIPAKDYIFEFGWDEFACFDVVGEEQRFINPNLVINGEICDYMGRTDLDPNTSRRWYGPDICNRHALNFIRKNKEKPFFLYCPMMLVHDEHKPTPDTKPHKVFDEFDEIKRNVDGRIGDDHRYFPDMIEYADTLIGRIVDEVDAQGLRENTIIIVMGDNGTKECFTHVLDDGTEYPARKGGNTDNGIHVPLILNYPGVIPHEDNNQPRKYSGLIHLTDIYPTIAEACGVEIPNLSSIDGISFWEQALGSDDAPRKVIHGWFNGNNPYTRKDSLTEYVFDKEFKRYAPNAHYPNGRFFDLRSDPLEREGQDYAELRWGVRQYAGLRVGELTSEQKEAYDRLGKELKSREIVRIQGLKIKANKKIIQVGEMINLDIEHIPHHTTRKNVVWKSSDPAIAEINKFGEVVAHKKGKVVISVYSWDDANPLANNRNPEFLTTGVQDHLQLLVR